MVEVLNNQNDYYQELRTENKTEKKICSSFGFYLTPDEQCTESKISQEQ